MNACNARGFYHFGRIDITESRNVVAYSAFEEFDVLREVADMSTQFAFIPGVHVGAIKAHNAVLRRPYAEQCSSQGGLARSARADDSHDGAAAAAKLTLRMMGPCCQVR